MIVAPAIEELELSSRRLEPIIRLTLKDDCQPAIGIRLELLWRVKVFPEAAEEISQHVWLVGRALAEIDRRFSGRRDESASAQLREATGDHHFIAAGCILPEMSRYLSGDKGCNLFLVKPEYLPDPIFLISRKEICGDLACEIVEKIGVARAMQRLVKSRILDIARAK